MDTDECIRTLERYHWDLEQAVAFQLDQQAVASSSSSSSSYAAAAMTTANSASGLRQRATTAPGQSQVSSSDQPISRSASMGPTTSSTPSRYLSLALAPFRWSLSTAWFLLSLVRRHAPLGPWLRALVDDLLAGPSPLIKHRDPTLMARDFIDVMKRTCPRAVENIPFQVKPYAQVCERERLPFYCVLYNGRYNSTTTSDHLHKCHRS